MIPKKIHYCWLSGDVMPDFIIKCMNTWQKNMPDYEIVLWDKEKFDIDSVPFVKQACAEKKWAFACDYIRLYALYTEGGIYLDSDVEVINSFTPMLEHGFFTSIEYHADIYRSQKSRSLLDVEFKPKVNGTVIPGIGLQAAIMGSIKGHPFLKECLDYYSDKNFILGNGLYFDQIIAPTIYAQVAEQFGFIYKDVSQSLSNNMEIYPSYVFAGNSKQITDKTYAVHQCVGSWRVKNYQYYLSSISNKLRALIS